MFLSRLKPVAGLIALATRSMSSLPQYQFETLAVTQPKEFVYQVELNRPQKRNALSIKLFSELEECFNKISTDGDCRAVVLSGAGKIFCAGMDLQDLLSAAQGQGESDAARRAYSMRPFIARIQGNISAAEKCMKPVIAVVHGACVGGGVDLITACDIRYCAQDAYYQIKEIDMGLAADIGTLQRLPKVIGHDSLVRELAYTGRKMHADEAKQVGLVSKIFSTKEEALDGALATAATIASKSPVAIQGIKVNMVYSRDHTVQEGLEYILTWNQGMLQSEDTIKAGMASMSKETPVFSKL